MKQTFVQKYIPKTAVFAVSLVFAAALLAGCRGKKADADMDYDDDAYWENWTRAIPSTTGDFQAATLDGALIGRDVFSGYKLTMLNVWATWCGPCLEEMPDLEKVARAREKDGVQIIGIVIDTHTEKGEIDAEKIELAKDILKKLGVTYQIIQPDKVLNEGLLKGIPAVPTTFFVGPDGQLIGAPEVGSRPESEWNAVIDERLGAL